MKARPVDCEEERGKLLRFPVSEENDTHTHTHTLQRAGHN